VITGRFDLDAELAAVGKANQILQRLDGPMELHTYDGMIRKFALVGNILAYVSLRGLFDKSRGGGIGEGFPYRDMRIRGYVSGGTFTLEHGSLDSDALGVAAIGTVSLTDGQVDLSALVAPFNGLDRIARVVPILGEVIGGLTSVPVRVSGDIRDPTVDPLDIGAVSGELAGIFERALKLPAKLIP
jgi:hypothetical protein